MFLFNRRKSIDRRSGKDRRNSNQGPKNGIERRGGRNRRMSLYDRLPDDQRNTLEIIIKHLEKQAN